MHGDVQNLTRKSDVKSKGEGGSPCSVLVGHMKTRGWNTNNPPSTAARTCILNQLRSVTYLNKGMEFAHLQNKQNKSKNKLVHAHTREKSTFE